MSPTPEIPAPSPEESDNASPSAFQLVALAALLGVGAALSFWLVKPGRMPGITVGMQIILLVVAAIFASIPLINRKLPRLLDPIRNPSPRARAWTAGAIWAVAFVYLILTAREQHRDLYPRLHDECSYTIQTKMLADGRLWLPKHELADFFETFHFLTKPVYGSIYFPGTALINVPGVWLRQPSWFIPVILAALVVALSYRVTAELVDGVAGILVALLVLATSMFRVYSTMVMAQTPVMLLGLLMAWAWLRWRRERKPGWAAAIGAFAGWAAITRPVDALAFALPIGVAMIWELLMRPALSGALPLIRFPGTPGEGREGAVRPSPIDCPLPAPPPQCRGREINAPTASRIPRTLVRTVGLLLAGAAPFLALQAVFDWGVTGKPWKTPYVSYLEQNQPGSVFGSGSNELNRPTTQLLQKQIYFDQLTALEERSRSGGTAAWLRGRARIAAQTALPFASLLLLVPAGFLLARERQRWALLIAAPLCFALYAFNPFFLPHYAVPLTMVLVLGAVLGARAIEGTIPWPAGRRFAATFGPAALALLAIASLPQLNSRVSDEPYRTPLLDHVEQTLAQIPGPAVVFFHFARGVNVHEEPVYNMDAVSPDDAPIIRAHDLGRRDAEVLQYYALRQPDRAYYIMDCRTGVLYPLGNALDAALAMHVRLNLPDLATADVR